VISSTDQLLVTKPLYWLAIADLAAGDPPFSTPEYRIVVYLIPLHSHKFACYMYTYIYIFPTFFVKSSYVPNFFRDASHCLRWPYFM
jgi:hypothetical protein